MWAITSKYYIETKLYTTIGLFLPFLYPLYLITKFCHFFTYFPVLFLLSIILLPLNSFRAFSLKSNIVGISSVQSLSRVWLFATPWTAAPQASLPITNSRSLLKIVYWIGDAIQPSHPLWSLSSSTSNLPSIRVFQMSQFFTSGGQSIGVSGSASVLPMNIQDWFPLGWTGCISLQSMGLSRVFSNTTVQ